MVIVRSGKTSVLAIRSTGLQEVQRTDSRAHDPLIHTLQRARERSILFIRNAEAHDPPAQLETLDEVLAQRQLERQRLESYAQGQVSPARFAATQGRRRYEHVDPAYRLAAAELEREWDERLRALRQAEEAAARFAHEPTEPTLTPEFRHQLLHLSQCLPELWESPQLRRPQRKAL